MRIALFIFSGVLILAAITLAVFVEPKSGNVTGAGWNVPFWPFVLVLGVILLLVSVAITPFGKDLIKMYFRTKVAIAQAENRAPQTDTSDLDGEKKPKPTPPPSEPPPPVETAKG